MCCLEFSKLRLLSFTGRTLVVTGNYHVGSREVPGISFSSLYVKVLALCCMDLLTVLEALGSVGAAFVRMWAMLS